MATHDFIERASRLLAEGTGFVNGQRVFVDANATVESVCAMLQARTGRQARPREEPLDRRGDPPAEQPSVQGGVQVVDRSSASTERLTGETLPEFPSDQVRRYEHLLEVLGKNPRECTEWEFELPEDAKKWMVNDTQKFLVFEFPTTSEFQEFFELCSFDRFTNETSDVQVTRGGFVFHRYLLSSEADSEGDARRRAVTIREELWSRIDQLEPETLRNDTREMLKQIAGQSSPKVSFLKEVKARRELGRLRSAIDTALENTTDGAKELRLLIDGLKASKQNLCIAEEFDIEGIKGDCSRLLQDEREMSRVAELLDGLQKDIRVAKKKEKATKRRYLNEALHLLKHYIDKDDVSGVAAVASSYREPVRKTKVLRCHTFSSHSLVAEKRRQMKRNDLLVGCFHDLCVLKNYLVKTKKHFEQAAEEKANGILGREPIRCHVHTDLWFDRVKNRALLQAVCKLQESCFTYSDDQPPERDPYLLKLSWYVVKAVCEIVSYRHTEPESREDVKEETVEDAVIAVKAWVTRARTIVLNRCGKRLQVDKSELTLHTKAMNKRRLWGEDGKSMCKFKVLKDTFSDSESIIVRLGKDSLCHKCDVASQVKVQKLPLEVERYICECFKFGLSDSDICQRIVNDLHRRDVHTSEKTRAHAIQPSDIQAVRLKHEETTILHKNDDIDMHMLLQQHREKVAGRDEEAFFVAYKAFQVHPDDPGCFGLDGVREFLKPEDFFVAMASEQMLRKAKEYGRILFADATHCVSVKDNVKLLTFLVVDGNNRGWPIFWGLSLYENDLIYRAMFGILQRLLCARGDAFRPEVLLSDHLNSPFVAGKYFYPQLRWLLCTFHTLKAVKQKVSEALVYKAPRTTRIDTVQGTEGSGDAHIAGQGTESRGGAHIAVQGTSGEGRVESSGGDALSTLQRLLLGDQSQNRNVGDQSQTRNVGDQSQNRNVDDQSQNRNVGDQSQNRNVGRQRGRKKITHRAPAKTSNRNTERNKQINSVLTSFREVLNAPTPDLFKKRETDFLAKIKKHHPELEKYFRDNYFAVGKPEMWALAYRTRETRFTNEDGEKQDAARTNAHLESFHHMLKTFLGQRKRIGVLLRNLMAVGAQYRYREFVDSEGMSRGSNLRDLEKRYLKWKSVQDEARGEAQGEAQRALFAQHFEGFELDLQSEDEDQEDGSNMDKEEASRHVEDDDDGHFFFHENDGDDEDAREAKGADETESPCFPLIEAGEDAFHSQGLADADIARAETRGTNTHPVTVFINSPECSAIWRNIGNLHKEIYRLGTERSFTGMIPSILPELQSAWRSLQFAKAKIKAPRDRIVTPLDRDSDPSRKFIAQRSAVSARQRREENRLQAKNNKRKPDSPAVHRLQNKRVRKGSRHVKIASGTGTGYLPPGHVPNISQNELEALAAENLRNAQAKIPELESTLDRITFDICFEGCYRLTLDQLQSLRPTARLKSSVLDAFFHVLQLEKQKQVVQEQLPVQVLQTAFWTALGSDTCCQALLGSHVLSILPLLEFGGFLVVDLCGKKLLGVNIKQVSLESFQQRFFPCDHEFVSERLEVHADINATDLHVWNAFLVRHLFISLSTSPSLHVATCGLQAFLGYPLAHVTAEVMNFRLEMAFTLCDPNIHLLQSEDDIRYGLMQLQFQVPFCFSRPGETVAEKARFLRWLLTEKLGEEVRASASYTHLKTRFRNAVEAREQQST